MDIASIVGVILGLLLMVGAIVVGGNSLAIFFDYPSMMVVYGGAAAALMTGQPLRRLVRLPKILWKCFANRPADHQGTIGQLVRLAEVARRDGLLAMERRAEELTHPFLKLGIQMASDGLRPEVVEEVLRTEMTATTARHKDAKGMFDQYGRFCPAFGMIGTLLGLVMMLQNMSDPSSLGGGMGIALLTTLYGTVAANAFVLPLAEKLSSLNKEETLEMEIILRGVLAIQFGENPRIIEQKLLSYLPPDERSDPDIFVYQTYERGLRQGFETRSTSERSRAA